MPVRHQHDGGVGQRAQPADQLLLGRRVDHAARLVEQQQARPGQQRAGDRDRLALAAREPLAAFANLRGDAAGQLRARSRRGRRRASPRAAPCRRLHAAELDVLAQRAVEQRHVLRHVADLAAQAQRFDLRVHQFVDEHAAGGRRVLVQDQLEQRALARTELADDADALAGADAQVRCARSSAAASGRRSVTSRNSTRPHSGGACRLAAASSVVGGHDLVERLVLQPRLLPAHHQAGDLRRRRHRAAGEHARRDDLAERQRVAAEEDRAERRRRRHRPAPARRVGVVDASEDLARVQRVVRDGLREATPTCAGSTLRRPAP